jgi:precorrin-6A/cobalt-precorrin-6A reductase
VTGPVAAGGPVLVLGGTTEGRELAAAAVGAGTDVISSLAGRVSAPRRPPGRVRSGGFGGAEGLAGYLRAEGVRALVDATHPFATRISANAERACALTGIPRLVLLRPAWTPVPGDRWTPVPDLAAAAAEIAAMAPRVRVLLTVGRQGVAAFADAPQRFWLRSVDPPEGAWPAGGELLTDRGPFTLDGERALLRRLRIDVLVTKNSGGPMTAAKLTAARELGLPVVMVERPPASEGAPRVADVAAAANWIRNVTHHPG